MQLTTGAAATAIREIGSQQAADSSRIVTQVAEQTGSEAKRVASSSEQLRTISEAISGAFQSFMEEISADLRERRTSSRHPVKRLVIVTRQGTRIEANAVDVSRTGMKVSDVSGVRVGDAVTADLGFESVRAKVAWTDRNGCGLEFETAISEEKLSDPRWQAMQDQDKIAA